MKISSKKILQNQVKLTFTKEPLAIKNLGIRSTFQSRPLPISVCGLAFGPKLL